jgi:hypothetical protein
MIKLEIKVTLNKLDQELNKEIDWLIKSFNKTGIDKEICLLQHKKYSLKRQTVAKQLYDLSQKGILE